jgi:hypothetical protein
MGRKKNDDDEEEMKNKKVYKEGYKERKRSVT